MLNVFGGAEHQAHFVLIVVLIFVLALRASLVQSTRLNVLNGLLALRARLNVIVVPICISVPIYVLICVLALRASVRSTSLHGLVLCTSLHGLVLCTSLHGHSFAGAQRSEATLSERSPDFLGYGTHYIYVFFFSS